MHNWKETATSFWSGVSKMRVRVRTNANKEAFHGKQLTAFLRRRPLTAVTYCYLPNRVRRWKKLADGKRSKLSRGGDGLNLPWTGHQRERERESRPITGAAAPKQNMQRSFMGARGPPSTAWIWRKNRWWPLHPHPAPAPSPAASESQQRAPRLRPPTHPIQWSSGAKHGCCVASRAPPRPRP